MTKHDGKTKTRKGETVWSCGRSSCSRCVRAMRESLGVACPTAGCYLPPGHRGDHPVPPDGQEVRWTGPEQFEYVPLGGGECGG